MIFQNRLEAAKMLAKQLKSYAGQNALVLGIPRGAVPMARHIADSLQADIDVVLVHKLGHPENPEYAVGAIDEQGHIYAEAGEYDQAEAEAQLKTLQERRKSYTAVRSRISATNRIVIIVDDGIATGWTVKAAVQSIRAENPAKIIVASPVGSSESVSEIRAMADEIICLSEPELFQAVGQFYAEFDQVTDEQVIEALS
ncbi:MAG: phosphoribosyltransferase [Deltaproteobacteria bacterium]|nr:phosphoribosyltransferase [Deltaproteobacteria bacterium]